MTINQVTRAQIKERAEALSTQTVPYNEAVQGENANFLSRLDEFEGSTLAEITASVDRKIQATADNYLQQVEELDQTALTHRVAGWAYFGGAAIAGLGLATRAASAGPVGLAALGALFAAGLAGGVYCGVKSCGAEVEAFEASCTVANRQQELDRFKDGLTAWGEVFSRS